MEIMRIQEIQEADSDGAWVLNLGAKRQCIGAAGRLWKMQREPQTWRTHGTTSKPICRKWWSNVKARRIRSSRMRTKLQQSVKENSLSR